MSKNTKLEKKAVRGAAAPDGRESMHEPFPTLSKSPTGIQGLDEILQGGLPTGRPTLVCGSAGCGKTLLALEFLVHGIQDFGEPGVFMAFEETEADLIKNVASLGFDLKEMIRDKKLFIDHVRVAREEIQETGEYDLEGLFIRLESAISEVGAKRVVLDTVESLFAGLTNTGVLRSELARLFRWLKDRGVTAVITGERGEGTLTRHGLEEYVSDCVIVLDHRIMDQISTRRIKVVKYRGSAHGHNEYPFLVNAKGIWVMPVTSLELDYEASRERISTGIPTLDEMMGGEGYFRGSTVLVSGSAGSGKSSVAASFAQAACQHGERVLYFAFEEAPKQILRNMCSIGLDLEPSLSDGQLRILAARTSFTGFEAHLSSMLQAIDDFQPQVVVVDPISAFTDMGKGQEVKTMLTRLVDFCKGRGATLLLTDLNQGGAALEHIDLAISSFADTWLLLRDIEIFGERNRALYLLKSRGMAHSNQIREFLLTDQGIELAPVYTGPAGVLTGSARLAQEAQDDAVTVARQYEVARQQRVVQGKRAAIEAQILALRAELDVDEAGATEAVGQVQQNETRLAADRAAMASSRHAAEPERR